MLVEQRFQLPIAALEDLKSRPIAWGFGGLSEATYYRTYSRKKDEDYAEACPWVEPDGMNEVWGETVYRVVNGVLSIRKDHYARHDIPWNDAYWSYVGMQLLEAIFNFHLLPPGRGLWAMGTKHVYEVGSAALNNCGFVDVQNLAHDAAWAKDMLMMGVGVGFSTGRLRTGVAGLDDHKKDFQTIWQIPDSREGWVESVRKLINRYFSSNPIDVAFDYSLIRPAGSPIRGFGGTASGPGPLLELHDRIHDILGNAEDRGHDDTRMVADIINSIGCCVVAGNVRRSAELATGSPYDATFMNLKNYDMFPDRAALGWMSNNSVLLEKSEDFLMLPEIAERIQDNGEPGILNMMSTRQFGRYGHLKADNAVGYNPCAEIPLEDKELCNLAEVFPTRCGTQTNLFNAIHLGTIYASTVALLPTHNAETNAVIERNRRIGVSLTGIADWLDSTHMSTVVRDMRRGYKIVESTNRLLAMEAGVNESIRLTTVKPSGTVSLLAGVSPGMHWPEFRYGIRRMRVSMNSPVAERLAGAGLPFETDTYSAGTYVFEFPQKTDNEKIRSSDEVSVWEKAATLATWQREWADNAVSNTLSFDPDTEKGEIEMVLATFAPVVKTMSLLPDNSKHGAYAQAPYERTTRDEYRRRLKEVKTIDWSDFRDSDGEDTRFCEADACEVPAA